MAKKTEMVEHRMCDLCGQEVYGDELITLHRTDNKFSAARMAVGGALGSQSAGEAHVDVCTTCRKRPINDVVALMYPS
jgi:hypothetical protein